MDDDFAQPPPAYTEEEFDQKISLALDASLSVNDEPEEWEEWDEAKFQAAAHRLEANAGASSSSSSSTRVADLLPAKQKHWEQYRQDKSRYREEEVTAQPSYSASSSSSSSHHSAEPVQASTPVLEAIRNDDDEDHSVPPPPFTPVGPSLDGPPFEEVVVLSPPESIYIPPMILTFDGEDLPAPSTPPSPPPIIARTPSPLRIPSPPPQDHVYRHSMPAVPNQGPRITPRPVTTYNPLQPKQPRIEFHSSVAYNKPPTGQGRLVNPSERVDPTAFYNSAVSAYLRPDRKSVV